MTIYGNKSLQPGKYLFSFAPCQQFPVSLLIQVPPVAHRKNRYKNDNQYDSQQEHQHQRGLGIYYHGGPFVSARQQVGEDTEAQNQPHWQSVLDILHKPALPVPVGLPKSNKPLFLIV